MNRLKRTIIPSLFVLVFAKGGHFLLQIDDQETNCVCAPSQTGRMSTWQVQCSDKHRKEIQPCVQSYGNVCRLISGSYSGQCDPIAEKGTLLFFVAEPVPSILSLSLFSLYICALVTFVICVLIYLRGRFNRRNRM